MKLKQSLLILFSLFTVLLSANSHAGRQGVNGYYGLGLGVFTTKYVDPAATGAVILGVEEDGWALEAVALASVETGTDDPETDYSIRGVDIGLGYRTIEKNNRYYLMKFSKTDIDFKDKETDSVTSITTSTTTETSGNSYTIGMGFRMARDARMEINYTFHSNDDLSDPAHLLSVSYLWGGAPYHGNSF